MRYIPKSSEVLQALQDSIGKQIAEREEQKKNYVPTPVEIKPDKKDISIEPTAEDSLLMEEYRRGVYQGD